jgi:hypothetical protein
MYTQFLPKRWIGLHFGRFSQTHLVTLILAHLARSGGRVLNFDFSAFLTFCVFSGKRATIKKLFTSGINCKFLEKISTGQPSSG